MSSTDTRLAAVALALFDADDAGLGAEDPVNACSQVTLGACVRGLRTVEQCLEPVDYNLVANEDVRGAPGRGHEMAGRQGLGALGSLSQPVDSH